MNESRIRLGVRQKMVLVLLTVLTLALTATGYYVMLQNEKTIKERAQQRGTDIVRFLSEALKYNVVSYDYHTIQLLLDNVVQFNDIAYVKVSGMTGNIMAESGKLPQRTESWLTFTTSISLDNANIGQLVVSLDSQPIISELASQKFSLVTREAIIVVLIAIGEFLALSYLIIRPLSMISKSLAASADETGRFVNEIPVVSSDEFGRLAVQFNTLSRKLNDANDLLQSKINLADEQLRRTNMELLTQSEQLKIMNEELKYLSMTDSLTGLYNRRQFEEFLRSEVAMNLRHSEPFSLILCDIDRFKAINDSYGHDGGDYVLKGVSKILKGSLRDADLLCRIGGEEFVVLCRKTNAKAAIHLADKLRYAIDDNIFQFNDKTIAVTSSFGIATMPCHDVDTPERLYKMADDALYYSKENGRNMVTHFNDIVVESVEESNL